MIDTCIAIDHLPVAAGERKITCCFFFSTCALAFLHVFQAVLHTVLVFISMCLMLVFMTFNTWLCVAVCAGAGVGYLLFGRYRHSSTDDSEEYCH